MNKPRPSDAELVEFLSQPSFQRAPQDPIPSTDPVTPTTMVVEVEQIQPYDHNPRRVPNAEYERITASIRACGMEQPLTITRRPGDELYMVAAGGNTRLQVVQELWRETRDKRFQRIHCLFRPWEGDTEVLLAHLKENDLRGDLTFIDRALAVRELRQLIEEEDAAALSVRKLADRLQELGYGIGKTLLSWFDYTVEVLYPAIPTLLERGMGRPQIEKIRAMERAYTEVWRSLGVGGPEEARAIFVAVLAKMEDIEFLDFDALRIDLCDEINVAVDDVDLHRIRMGFDAALQGQPVGDLRAGLGDKSGREPELGPPGREAPQAPAQGPADSPSVPAPDPPRSPQPTRPAAETPAEPPAAGHSIPSPEHADVLSTTDELPNGSRPPGHIPDTGDDLPPERPPADADEAAHIAYGTEYLQWREREVQRQMAKPFLPFGMELPPDLRGLRIAAWKSAGLFSERAGLGYIVTELPEAGFGFLVGPPQPQSDAMTPGESRELAAAWWCLVTLSGQFAPDSTASRHLPKEWREQPIGEALRQGPAFERWYQPYVHHVLHMDPRIGKALRENEGGDAPGIQAMDRETYQVMDAMPWVGLSELAPGLLAVPERAWTDWWHLATYCRAVRRLTDGKPWAQE
jgi:ParB family protein of integrating conjugative element (PFGI_1 class)